MTLQATKPVEPRLRRWTRAEYYDMFDRGMFEGQRVQLIEGEIIEMPAQGNLHVATISKSDEALRPVLPPNTWIRYQAPLDATVDSDPEPDLAVVSGSPDECTSEHPKTALLAIEVSDTTLALDRRKTTIYAAARVQDYWIINLQDGVLEVHRNPTRAPSASSGYRYAEVRVLSLGESVAPLMNPQKCIAVSDLFPKTWQSH
ncbi:MAG: Uma2 family endonuclease [Tepidisphaeraceae bacterium]